jgi:hypothetical protein
MRQPFFHDEPESKPVSHLGQKIGDNDRLPRIGHSEKDAVLRSVSESRPDPEEIYDTTNRHFSIYEDDKSSATSTARFTCC